MTENFYVSRGLENSGSNHTSVILRPALTGTVEGMRVEEKFCLVRVTDLASLANLLKPEHVIQYTCNSWRIN